jgi:hypothetical protein
VSVSPGTTWGYTITRDWQDLLYVRPAPQVSSSYLTVFPPGGGQSVQVVCQVWGGGYKDPTGTPNFPNGAVWDKLSSGGYVADYYTTTPNATSNSFSSPIWKCQ